MAVNKNIKWDSTYQEMTTVPILTMGETNNYNLVWSFPFDETRVKGFLRGTVTEVLDGDTIRLRLAYDNPFSYPIKKILSLRRFFNRAINANCGGQTS
jgi:hypothetical protein